MITLTPQTEYWFHVANQEDIPIAGIVDKSLDIDKLLSFFKEFSVADDKYKYLQNSIAKDIDLVDILRTLVGVSDKRMYLELSYLFAKTRSTQDENKNILGGSFYELNKHPLSFFKNLTKSPDKQLVVSSLKLITDYLIGRGLVEIVQTLSKLNFQELECLIKNLILTKEVQQAEAKRRGHGAEFELAKIIHLLGCDMIPEERYKKAIGYMDPNVDKYTLEVKKKEKGHSWSFDLIIMHERVPTVFIQSLIHTSDPGQYGVNKSDETVQIKQDINDYNRKNSSKRELWGLVDGVGFCENKKDTIDKMLTEFDCFIQLKTLYKAGLQLHKLGMVKIKGIKFDDSSYTQEMIRDMFTKYGCDDIKVYNSSDTVDGTLIPAGLATLIL